MKIGILTVHDSIVNYGSFLQAVSLYEFLENEGHTAYFIYKDSKESLLKKYYYNNHRNPIKKINTYLTESSKLKKKYNLFYKEWKNYRLLYYQDIQILDLVVCGSDELWNIRNKDVYDNYYYGEFVQSMPKIAYAISIGDSSKIDFINNKDKVKLIKEFNSISARDINTSNTLQEFNIITAENVCDPTVLRIQSFYKNVTPCTGEYILVYSYGFDKRISKLIKKFATKNNLKIISPLMDCSIASEVPYVSCLEFLSLIKGAKYVITSTFHGALLSALLNVNVSVYCTKSKTKEILNKYRLAHKEITLNMSDEEFKEVLNRPIDYIITNKYINEDRIKSQKILRKQLEEITHG
ncbi:hypothetical protein B5E48_04845 [Massilimicrobiota sp. An105]|uniref:polysaccharide pyruvyl transferase family protein n=1 Tax=Massilimicrobiota sp. An105 TaxID=1965540 RepID=UPI000B3788AD|nr:polysaccharide pyruvyl transferase family protein [Massilimicrobiota sp. An105]OUQ80711.1 hypothetical protein B5E48_04845 [Massilimicrobiota sp. An105]